MVNSVTSYQEGPVLKSPCLCTFSPSTLASSYSLMHVRVVGHSKLPTGFTVSVNDCLNLCVVSEIDWRPV